MNDRLSTEQSRKIDEILAGAAAAGRGHLFEHEVYRILQILGLQYLGRRVGTFFIAVLRVFLI